MTNKQRDGTGEEHQLTGERCGKSLIEFPHVYLAAIKMPGVSTRSCVEHMFKQRYLPENRTVYKIKSMNAK